MSETPTADREPDTCEVTSDDLHIIPDPGPPWSCSRPVWDDDRCVWHADATDKPPEELAATVGDGVLYEAQLSGVDLPGVSVLSGTRLVGADLSNARLSDADLSNAKLRDADLSNAKLRNADLENASLFNADLSNASLRDADLPDANLRDADLSNKDLSGVNLSRADLRDISIVGMSADQSTTVGRMCTGLSKPHEYDELAQGYHELKQALSEEGLSQRARQARALEQQARTAESWARFKRQLIERVSPGETVEGVRQWVFPPWPGPEIRTQFFTWVGGTLSRYLTGYGTRPLYVILWTAAIVYVTSALFALGPAPPDGGWQGGPLYYSVVTFVTAPPHPPRGVGAVTQTAVLLETYFGTALIVLLGYVLGTRERV